MNTGNGSWDRETVNIGKRRNSLLISEKLGVQGKEIHPAEAKKLLLKGEKEGFLSSF